MPGPWRRFSGRRGFNYLHSEGFRAPTRVLLPSSWPLLIFFLVPLWRGPPTQFLWCSRSMPVRWLLGSFWRGLGPPFGGFVPLRDDPEGIPLYLVGWTLETGLCWMLCVWRQVFAAQYREVLNSDTLLCVPRVNRPLFPNHHAIQKQE